MAKPVVKKILFVDDEVYYQKFYGQPLKKAGYNIDFAKNGELALKKLKTGKYDLIILDLIMPMVSGISVLKKLNRKDQKVIILTTMDNDADKQDAKMYGAVTFLIKMETKPDQLLQKVEQIIKQ